MKSAVACTTAVALAFVSGLCAGRVWPGLQGAGFPAAAWPALAASLAAILLGRELLAVWRRKAHMSHAREELESQFAERIAEINTANVALQAEIIERQRAEDALRIAQRELESRVAERTRELADANHILKREIVERRQITEALKNSRTLYHSLVEHLPVNVWRTDTSGRFTFVNDHFCDCLGVGYEDFLGRTAFDFFRSATAEKFAQDDRHVLDTGEPLEAVHEFETLGGRHGFEQVLKTPFHDAAGCVLGVQSISWDVTERRRAEKEMTRIQAQLQRTNADLVRRNEEVQSFYHTLSHELKTPLTSAREFIAIVLDGIAGGLTEAQRDYLSIALESCNQLRICLNDLLDATRLETGKLSIELKPASLGRVVSRAVTALTPAALSRHVELRCQVEPDLPELPIDESRVTQVVTNLLNNALKFTGAGGRVLVNVSAAVEDPGLLEVSVSDTGCGIPEDQTERIFDRLYQVRSGDASTEQGVGLGLYLCRELVRLHGGSIGVESVAGKGSTFTFRLPVHPPLGPLLTRDRAHPDCERSGHRVTALTTHPSPLAPGLPATNRLSEAVEKAEP